VPFRCVKCGGSPTGALASWPSERLARGEIEAEEYTARLRALRDAGR
jgi:hypothetical protein